MGQVLQHAWATAYDLPTVRIPGRTYPKRRSVAGRIRRFSLHTAGRTERFSAGATAHSLITTGIYRTLSPSPARPQKPPLNSYSPPLNVPASAWPAAPRNVRSPPAPLPPPPSAVHQERSYPPPLWAAIRAAPAPSSSASRRAAEKFTPDAVHWLLSSSRAAAPISCHGGCP